MDKPTVGSLFSGIGGIGLGFERAGWQIVWQVENDPFCNKVLAKHWPGVQRYGDIKDFPPVDVFRPDIIVGGPPCQPHSIAGRREGAADDRDLWPEFLRVVGEIRPNWVLFENVPGIKSIGIPVGLPHVVSRATARLEDSDEYTALFTQQERMYLDIICEDLEAIGYEVVPLIIPAAAFAAPHLRYRVFVVAHAESKRTPAAEQSRSRRSPITSGQTTADANGPWKLQPPGRGRHERGRVSDGCEDVSDANGAGSQGRRASGAVGDGGKAVANANGKQAVGTPIPRQECNFGATERRVRRVAHGLSQGLDGLDGHWDAEWPGVPRVITGQVDRINRLRALGNAVVPQEAQWLAEMIMEVEEAQLNNDRHGGAVPSVRIGTYY